MANTHVGKLHKNRIVKDLNGGIIDWFDEANGGWIVKSRQVINKERWNQEMAKQQDKVDAAKAVTMAKVREDYPETKEGTTEPTKVDKLEKEVNEMKDTLQAILKAVQK